MEETGQIEPQRLLVFSLAGLSCALPLAHIEEVVPMALLSTPPGLPEVLEGFLNLRGTLVPVVRTECLFHFPQGELTLQTPLLIVRNRQAMTDRPAPADSVNCPLLAFRVDRVREVISAELNTPDSLPAGAVFNGCAVAQVGFGDAAIHVLSMERLLIEQERRTITCLQAEMQTRLNGLAGQRPTPLS